MGQKKVRNWILNNPFFCTKGQFSKSAFIAMNTWVVVMIKYLISGMSFSYTKAPSFVSGIMIPASNITYTVRFDSGEAVALLTLVFGLYFGNKFAPQQQSQETVKTMQSSETISTSSVPPVPLLPTNKP